MKNRLLTLAAALALLGVLGKFYAPPLMAQVRPALVQDVDQPGRAPFQVTVPINIDNFNFTPVTIPAGHRLVIDYISMSGATQTSGAYVQPIIIFSSSVASGPSNLYYVAPQQSGTVPGQYYHTEQATIYADSLSVSPAFAGFTPSFMAFNVVISGHLISLP
ncbi:MAG: hypothetical protein ABSG25_01420 [Bryobacteraceae bacterium]